MTTKRRALDVLSSLHEKIGQNRANPEHAKYLAEVRDYLLSIGRTERKVG